MIYFDINKHAYANEIPNYICIVEDNIWTEYAGTDKWDIINGVFTDISDTPEYKAKEAAKREADFNLAFFNTSLGYIRRVVTMADGSHKDFLSDLLPAIYASTSAGTPVNIIAYTKPPFDHDIKDWTEYQNIVVATPQFIQECFAQLGNDFLPINVE